LRIESAEPQVAEAEAALDILKVDSLSADHILVEGKSLADRWPHLGREDKRRIVEDLLEEITVGKEEVAINLLYFPSSTKDGVKRQRDECGLSVAPAIYSAIIEHPSRCR